MKVHIVFGRVDSLLCSPVDKILSREGRIGIARLLACSTHRTSREKDWNYEVFEMHRVQASRSGNGFAVGGVVSGNGIAVESARLESLEVWHRAVAQWSPSPNETRMESYSEFRSVTVPKSVVGVLTLSQNMHK